MFGLLSATYCIGVPVFFTTIIAAEASLNGVKRLFWLIIAFAAALLCSAMIALNCGEEIWYKFFIQRSCRSSPLRTFSSRAGHRQQTSARETHC